MQYLIHPLFEQHGYVILQDLIEDDLLDIVAAETAKQGEAQDKWHTSKPIMELGYHPAILSYLENLYGYEPIPFQTLNFHVPPVFGLHTDTIHFSSSPFGWMCGVWVALEDITEDNGPLIYYPGSHKLPFLDFEDLGMTNSTNCDEFMRNLGEYSEWLWKIVRRDKMPFKQLICSRGTILIWHAHLLHRSIKPKRKSITRSSQVTHYYFRYPNVKFILPSQGKDYPKNNVFAMQNKAKEWRII